MARGPRRGVGADRSVRAERARGIARRRYLRTRPDQLLQTAQRRLHPLWQARRRAANSDVVRTGGRVCSGRDRRQRGERAAGIRGAMKTTLVILAAAAFIAAVPHARAGTRAGEQRFRDLYKELIETNTTLSAGSCTLSAERMAAHLKAAGFADADLPPFAAPDHPKEGGLVAVLPGRSRPAKPMLLLGHLDVVEARREDWTRDPFTLVEADGYFFGRGT